MSNLTAKLTPKQQEMIAAYADNSIKFKRYPNRGDMRDLGFSRDAIRAAFGSLERLKSLAKKKYAKSFEGITEERLFSPKKKALLKQALKGKTFVITTAVENAPVHKAFLASIDTFLKKQNAQLLILPSGSDALSMDEAIADRNWIFEDTSLNSNIWISAVKIPPKTKNPLDGLGEIGQRDGSLIAASPRQALEFIDVGAEKFGHAIMTTGAITLARFSNKKGIVSKQDYIANHDHTIGAVIIEIVDDNKYHFRQIQADAKGHFYDLGVKYMPKNKTLKEAPIAMLWGDLHSGEVDPTARKASREQMKLTGVRNIFWGDAFAGQSINHHEWDHNVTRAILASRAQLNLRAELKELAREIDDITSDPNVDTLTIIESNHHDFLRSYLQRGWYMRDPHNFEIAHTLAAAMVQGINPLQYAIEKVIGIKFPKKVKWLKRDQDVKAAGVQMGQHGDRGAKGSKGSKRTLSRGYGRIMHGHTHSPYIYRDVFCVGTNSVLRPPFVEGASSWVHCNGFVYKSGMCQMINSFNGEWRDRRKQ